MKEVAKDYTYNLYDEDGYRRQVSTSYKVDDVVPVEEEIGGEDLFDVEKIECIEPNGKTTTWERVDEYFYVVEEVKPKTSYGRTTPAPKWELPKEEITTKTGGNKNMNLRGLTEIFGDSFDFGLVKNAKLTLDGKVAVSAAGRFKVYDPTKKTVVDTTELSIDGNGLIMKLPVQKLTATDVIVKDGRYYFVKEVNEDNEVKVVSLDDNKIETFAPETNLLGVNFFTKVVSVLSGFGGTDAAAANPMQALMFSKILGKKDSIDSNDGLMTILAMQSLTGNGSGFEGIFANPMTLLMLTDKSGKFGDILPLMMMSGATGTNGATAMNPMMLMMMAGGDKGAFSDLLPIMAMSGATGGANPFGNIFGAPAAKGKKGETTK